MIATNVRKRTTLKSGDLIFTHDGLALIVLGPPILEDKLGNLLDGMLVVLAPDGGTHLHLPGMTPAAGRPAFLTPWAFGWEETHVDGRI
jgi:hypothetical protein